MKAQLLGLSLVSGYSVTSVLFTIVIITFNTSVLATDIGQIDQLTQQWLDIDRQATQLQVDWQTQKPILSQRRSLLEAEKAQLQFLLKESNESQEGVAARRKELLEEQTKLEQQQHNLTQSLKLLTARVNSFKAILPPPLVMVWNDEQSTLNQDPDASQQLQVAISQLSQLTDFDTRVSVHQAPITLSNNKEVMVKQLYLGVGMAWFTSIDGQHAGWGRASNNAWVWNLDDDLDSKAILNAIAIFEKKKMASLVRLPVKLASTPQAKNK